MKLNKFTYLNLIIIIAILFGCDYHDEPFADQPDSIAANPHFFVQGSIDGKPINVVAGHNDYYMTCQTDTAQNGVLLYNGFLRKKYCNSECPESFNIQLLDSRGTNFAQAQSINPDSMIRIGSNPLYRQSISMPVLLGYNIALTASSVNPYAICNWNINDQIDTSLQQFQVFYPFQDTTKQYLTVSYRSRLDGGKYIFVKRTIPLKPNQSFVDFKIEPLIEEAHYKLSVWGHFGPNTTQEFMWDNGEEVIFEDSLKNIFILPQHLFNPHLIVKIKQNGHLVAMAQRKIIPELPPWFFNPSFNYNIESVYRRPKASKATTSSFVWVDSAGVAYSSASINQSALAMIQILDDESYHLLQEGNPVRRIKFRITNTKLYHGNQYVMIDSLEGYMGVGVPVK